jgi:dienelactone hydrolase
MVGPASHRENNMILSSRRFSWPCLLAAFLSLLSAAPALAQHPPVFANKAVMGPHPVGVRLVEQYDRSRIFQPAIDELGRPYPGERARPIQTLIWYPAENGPRKPMTWGDYFALGDTEVSFGRPRATPAAADYFRSLVAPAFNDPMAGMKDARPAHGHFPVIIYAPSFSSGAWENAELCEYLASWGYLVIASPGMGVGHQSTHDVAGTDAQARDIAFLVGYAHTLPDADADHLAVVGFSWGGLSNLFAAARDDRIKALVDLDGSIRYWPGLVKAEGIDPSRMTIPLLFFKSQDSIERQAALEADFKVAAGPSVLNAWTAGDFYSVDMLRMTHPEFATIVYRNPNFWRDEFAHLLPGDSTRQDGIDGYALMEAYTKAFLDHYLEGRPEGLAFLKAPPAEHNIPPHVLVVEARPGTGTPFDFARFRTEVLARGYDQVAQAYADARKSHTDFKLASGDLEGWANDLVAGGHPAEAIAVAKFALETDSSADAYNALGTAYLAAGRTEDASRSFQQALAKSPGHWFAQSALDHIKTSTTH